MRFNSTADEIRKNKGLLPIYEGDPDRVTIDFENDQNLKNLDRFSKDVGAALRSGNKDALISVSIEGKPGEYVQKPLSEYVKELGIDTSINDFFSTDPSLKEKALGTLFTAQFEKELKPKTSASMYGASEKKLRMECDLLQAKYELASVNGNKAEMEKLDGQIAQKMTKLLEVSATAGPENLAELEGKELWCRHSAPVMCVMLDNAGVKSTCISGFAHQEGTNSIIKHVTCKTENAHYIDAVNGHKFCFGKSQPVAGSDWRNDDEKRQNLVDDFIMYGDGFKRIFSNTSASTNMSYAHFMLERNNHDPYPDMQPYKDFLKNRIENLEKEVGKQAAVEFMQSKDGNALTMIAGGFKSAFGAVAGMFDRRAPDQSYAQNTGQQNHIG